MIIGVRHQEIGGRYGPVESIRQFVHEMVNGAGHFALRVGVGILAEQCQCLSIEGELDVRKPASARRMQLVGPLSVNVPELASATFWFSAVSIWRFES